MTIPDRQGVIDRFVAKIEAEDRRTTKAERNGHCAKSPRLRDETIIQKLGNSPNAGVREDFANLWVGNWEGKYPSPSEADRALCRLIGYYTQNGEQIARIFECSGLYRADKWGRRSDYRDRTIGNALSSLTRFYQEPKKNGSKLHHDHGPYRKSEDDEAPIWRDSPETHPDLIEGLKEQAVSELIRLLDRRPDWLREQARKCLEEGSPDHLLKPLASTIALEYLGDVRHWREALPFVKENLEDLA